jgi:hypothetical protein
MMLVLQLEPELEKQVQEAAHERGQSVEQYTLDLLRREAAVRQVIRRPRVSAAGAFAHAPFTVAEFLEEQRQEALREAERDERHWLGTAP